MFSAARKNELQKPDRDPFDVNFKRGLNTLKTRASEKLSRSRDDHVMCS